MSLLACLGRVAVAVELQQRNVEVIPAVQNAGGGPERPSGASGAGGLQGLVVDSWQLLQRGKLCGTETPRWWLCNWQSTAVVGGCL